MKIKQKITEEVKLRTTILKKLMVTKSKSVQKNMLNKLVNKFGIFKRYARILLEVDSLGDNTKNNYIKNKLRFRNLGIDFENDLEKTINRTDKIIEFILNNDEDIRKGIDITYVTKEKFK